MNGWHDVFGIYHSGDFDEELLPGPPEWTPEDAEAIAVASLAVVRARNVAETSQALVIVPEVLAPERFHIAYEPCDRCRKDTPAANRLHAWSKGRLFCEDCTAYVFRFGDTPISDAKGLSLLARAVRSRLRKGGR
jgi:hypothetical protein